jgi:uncharacterized phiE125 gp8 family phage protein
VSRRVQKIVSGPAETPISLAEAKKQLRVDWPDDDTEITSKISGAVLMAEQYLQRKLVTQTWKMFLDSWPASIKVLFGDLQSVTHVKYTDSEEVQYTFDSSKYLVDTDSVPGRIILKTNETWPTDTLSPKNPIEVQFVTGYGAAADVPQDIKDAILITVSDRFNYRENFVLNNKMNVEQLPDGTKSLLYPHRVWDWII